MSEEKAGYGWRSDMGITLVDKIKSDLKAAMKSKDTAHRDAIRLIMGEYPSLTVPITLESGKKSFRVKQASEITDEDLLDIIRKQAKSEKSVLELKKEAGSDYLSALETYLPKLATEEEIRAWVSENIDFSNFKAPMQAMGTIMKHFGKLADGNLVKSILQDFSG